MSDQVSSQETQWSLAENNLSLKKLLEALCAL